MPEQIIVVTFFQVPTGVMGSCKQASSTLWVITVFLLVFLWVSNYCFRFVSTLMSYSCQIFKLFIHAPHIQEHETCLRHVFQTLVIFLDVLFQGVQ